MEASGAEGHQSAGFDQKILPSPILGAARANQRNRVIARITFWYDADLKIIPVRQYYVELTVS